MDDDFWDKIEENPNKTKATPEFWKEVESHPAFCSNIDMSKDLAPDIAAMQALKFESEDPVSNATSFKEEGNIHYTNKNYKLAIENYTKGITIKADDQILNAVLYTNRAICQFYLGNFGSCIKDCLMANKINPNHLKAYVRGALASFELNKMDQCQEFCVAGLKVDMKCTTLTDLQKKVLRKQVSMQKEMVTKASSQLKANAAKEELQRIIKLRGVIIDTAGDTPSEIPEQFRDCVYLDENKELHWPIVFLYPEYSQMDFLQDNAESARLEDCLAVVFDPNVDPPSWDTGRHYKLDNNLEVYCANSEKKQVRLNKGACLAQIISSNKFLVPKHLVLTFTVITKASTTFYNEWRTKYMT